jgi:hypothetical protein
MSAWATYRLERDATGRLVVELDDPAGMRMHDGRWLPEGQVFWRATHWMLAQAREGEHFPPGYGVSFRDPVTDTVYLAPIPLNFAIGWARAIWLRLKAGPFVRERAR